MWSTAKNLVFSNSCTQKLSFLLDMLKTHLYTFKNLIPKSISRSETESRVLILKVNENKKTPHLVLLETFLLSFVVLA